MSLHFSVQIDAFAPTILTFAAPTACCDRIRELLICCGRVYRSMPRRQNEATRAADAGLEGVVSRPRLPKRCAAHDPNHSKDPPQPRYLR
jgi:hypothetical protein